MAVQPTQAPACMIILSYVLIVSDDVPPSGKARAGGRSARQREQPRAAAGQPGLACGQAAQENSGETMDVVWL